MPDDGMFGWTLRCSPRGEGNAIEINGVLAVNCYLGSGNGSFQQTGTWLVPVKKNDIVVIQYSNAPGWFRTQFIAYR